MVSSTGRRPLTLGWPFTVLARLQGVPVALLSRDVGRTDPPHHPAFSRSLIQSQGAIAYLKYFWLKEPSFSIAPDP